MIAGVCGGIAEWMGWDPTVVRLAYVLLSILSAGFPGILVYLVFWLVAPPGGRLRPPDPSSGRRCQSVTSARDPRGRFGNYGCRYSPFVGGR